MAFVAPGKLQQMAARYPMVQLTLSIGVVDSGFVGGNETATDSAAACPLPATARSRAEVFGPDLQKWGTYPFGLVHA